jgi:hypothetical protein
MSAIKSHYEELSRAGHIHRTLGIRAAAGYMYRRGWSLDAALWVLLRSTNVKPQFPEVPA